MSKLFINSVAAFLLSTTIAVFLPISASATQSVTIPNDYKDRNTNTDNGSGANDNIDATTDTTYYQSTNVGDGENQTPNNSNNTILEEAPDYSAQQQNSSGQLIINEPLDNSVPVIYKYEIQGDGYITPGEEFTLKFMIYNPAVVSKLGNISVTVTQQDNLIYPTYKGTNSVYLGYLNTLSYAEGEVKLMASKNISEDEIVVNLTLNYTDNYSRDNKSSFTAVLPVSASGKLNIDNVEMPALGHVGGNNRIKISYSNNSLSTINELVLHLDVADLEEQTIDLGSIGRGSSLLTDVYAEFATAGEQNVNIKFTYSDESGQKYESETMEYTVNVEDYDNSEQQDELFYMNRRNTMNKIITIGALIACLLVLGVNSKKYLGFGKYLSNRKRNNKKVK